MRWPPQHAWSTSTNNVDEEPQEGVYEQESLDGSRLASGVYFLRLEFNGKHLIRRMVLTK